MNINVGIVLAASAVAGVIVPLIASWLNGIKKTQAVMFGKHDALSKDLQDYKLKVAETYVNKEALREALQPINDALKELRQDLHVERRDRP